MFYSDSSNKQYARDRETRRGGTSVSERLCATEFGGWPICV